MINGLEFNICAAFLKKSHEACLYRLVVIDNYIYLFQDRYENGKLKITNVFPCSETGHFVWGYTWREGEDINRNHLKPFARVSSKGGPEPGPEPSQNLEIASAIKMLAGLIK